VSHRFGAFRRRAVEIEQKYHTRGWRGREAVADTITVDDLAKYIDEDESPRCSLRRPRIYEFVAEHRETIGLHLPGQPFVKPARRPSVFTGVPARRVEMPWRRPWGVLTSHTTYRPNRQIDAGSEQGLDDDLKVKIDTAIDALLKSEGRAR
jgi:hypothetical protein